MADNINKSAFADTKTYTEFFKLRWVSSFLLIFVIVLVASIFFTVRYAIYQSFDKFVSDKLQEYSFAIEDKINDDFKILNSLAATLKSDTYRFTEFEIESIPINNLQYIGVYNKSLSVISLGYEGYETIKFFNIPREARNCLLEALSGKKSASSPFIIQKSGKRVIALATPIYDVNNNINAVFFVIKELGVYKDLLDNLDLDQNYEDIFVVNSLGNIIVSGQGNIVAKYNSIYDIHDYPSQYVTQFQLALVSDRHSYFDMNLYGVNYVISAVPTTTLDWYVVYISKKNFQYLVNALHLLPSIVMLIISILAIVFIIYYLNRSLGWQQQKARHAVWVDFLDKLCSYTSFLEHLNNKKISVVALHIQNFRHICRILGNKQADLLLEKIMYFAYQQNKISYICRHFSDHFYFILNSNDIAYVENIVDSFVKDLDDWFTSTFPQYHFVLSIGVALADDKYQGVDLLRNSKLAQQANDISSTHCIKYFDEELEESSNRLSYVEHNIAKALSKNEFKVFLQPKIDLRDYDIFSAEAKLFWVSEGDIVIPPSTYMYAMESNFGIDLDLYLFKEVCSLIKKWEDLKLEPISITVNQSAKFIFRDDYCERLQGMMRTYSIPRGLITIEISQNDAVSDVSCLDKIISDLHKIGLNVSLGNFGNGHSSINISSTLDIDEVKFDKQFLLEALSNKSSKGFLLLKSLIKLANSFHIIPTFEGITSKEDLTLLEQISSINDPIIVQGNYFEKPLDASKFANKYMTKKELI